MGVGYSLIWAIKVCAAPKGVIFVVVLVRNRVSILTTLVSNRVWLLHSSLEWTTFDILKIFNSTVRLRTQTKEIK